MHPLLKWVMFCFCFGFALVEEFVDVFFGHQSLFLYFVVVVGGPADRLVELGGAVLPQRVRVDRFQYVRNIVGQIADGNSFFFALIFMQILFLMHITTIIIIYNYALILESAF